MAFLLVTYYILIRVVFHLQVTTSLYKYTECEITKIHNMNSILEFILISKSNKSGMYTIEPVPIYTLPRGESRLIKSKNFLIVYYKRSMCQTEKSTSTLFYVHPL